jgi:ATP-dependent Lon protease
MLKSEPTNVRQIQEPSMSISVRDEASSAGKRSDNPEPGRLARFEKLPEDALIILAVRRMVLFPGVSIPIVIGRAKSIAAVAVAAKLGRPIGVVMQKEAEDADPAPRDLFKVGTLARITRYVPSPDGAHHVICEGESRIKITEYIEGYPFLVARYKKIAEKTKRTAAIDARFMKLKDMALEALSLIPDIPLDFIQSIAAIDQPVEFTDLVAQHMDFESQEKQDILEIINLRTRMDRMIDLLSYRIEVLKLSQDIGRQTQEKMSKQQREHILRQQLQEIRRQLGEINGGGEELAELKSAIEASGMSEEAHTHALKELTRLERMPEASSEYGMVRSYLETLSQLPWKEPDPRGINLQKARRILDEDHYGLEKVKKRILEFLAVRMLNPEGKSPILCFVGPPGVGKTSLGQSIARAMGRDFARLSLGGLHDESEIRGHRMTYIGAMPGNIIKTIERTGSRDCVFMLDEMDKLGISARGDPASAMLEVLDPVQNNAFRDNYLGVAFDLSRIVFIATANVLGNIPGPLRDRMEVIELAGYTVEEKLEIAKRYLVKRQLKANGLTQSQCRFHKSALTAIIEGYTREAGVRNLERKIGAVARHIAMAVAEGKSKKMSITKADIADILGASRFKGEAALRTSVPGVATGLAWTPVGGDMLFIEATKYAGTGKLVLTGQLGDVMRESVKAALSLVKSRSEVLQIPQDTFSTQDIHVHVPAGAIPKDGPSAGTAMFVALVSLFKDQRVRSDTAMTGEISLRGLVLPVGGVKEKVIAAARGGIKRVMLPAENKPDLDDIPESARKRLQFIWLETVDQALDASLRKK